MAELRKGNYLASFPTIAELAARRTWFAVKNLVRRQAIAKSEYDACFHGKTAAEWAGHHGCSRIAEEIRYYAHLPMAQLREEQQRNKAATKTTEELQRQLSEQAAKFSALEDQIMALTAELQGREAEVAELNEMVAVLKTQRLVETIDPV